MPVEQLKISLIQPDIKWEDKAANLQQYENYLEGISGQKHIVVFPEMFSTGFSMSPELLAEPMTGPTVVWMREMATKHCCILTGSLMIEEEESYFNRLIWMQPNGEYGIYDKRHLFGFAGEDRHYTRGDKRFIASVDGWKICLQVCYDLRFPVWSRNQAGEYDLLIYVANWPEKRSTAWKALLQARAIENMSYVIGVNRVGTDGYGIPYAGESSVFGPLGETIWQHNQTPAAHTVTLDKQILIKTRADFPFLQDADRFILL